MDNQSIAQALLEWADLHAAAGDNPFRVRAYRNAARTLSTMGEPVVDWVKQGRDLRGIRGVGPAIAAAILELVRTGRWAALEERRGTLRLAVETVPPRRRVRAPPAGLPALGLRGDLHTHTHATDGRDSILAMAAAARDRGLEYIAITDHSKETRVAGGLDDARMRQHLDRIRRADEAIDGITVLAGSEVDIKRDGSLDFPDALLKDMDVVVCSVHFRHRLTGPEQTERILKAMANDHASILAHPTGRRRGIRPAMDLDMQRITDAARDQGWAIEMNGSPERMDLDAASARLAAKKGVLLALDSDAHSVAELENIWNCQREAGKAGLRPQDILNTRRLRDLRRRLRH